MAHLKMAVQVSQVAARRVLHERERKSERARERALRKESCLNGFLRELSATAKKKVHRKGDTYMSLILSGK